jgi:hypothetical protein
LAHVDDYQALFYPCDAQNQPLKQALQEAVVNPFTPEQINDYLQKYVYTHQEDIKHFIIKNVKETDDWTDWRLIQPIFKYGLQHLLSSPFVLSLVAQVLPEIMMKYQDRENRENKENIHTNSLQQSFSECKGHQC